MPIVRRVADLALNVAIGNKDSTVVTKSDQKTINLTCNRGTPAVAVLLRLQLLQAIRF